MMESTVLITILSCGPALKKNKLITKAIPTANNNMENMNMTILISFVEKL